MAITTERFPAMPEGAEATTARGRAKPCTVEGRRIQAVTLRRPDLPADPAEVARDRPALCGAVRNTC